jgi:hypothetical protein
MLEALSFSETAGVLANRWFQPLTHVSSGGFARVSAVSCQRGMRGKREGQRFAVAQSGAQSVLGVFR